MVAPRTIRHRILVPLVIAFIILVVGLTLSFNRLQSHIFSGVVEQNCAHFKRLFLSHVEHDTVVLGSLIDVLILNDNVRGAFQARDRESLRQQTEALFGKFRLSHQVSRLSFIDVDRRTILRLHDLEKHSDIINRQTLLTAQEEGRSSAGLELGLSGDMTLRMVKPWYNKGQLLGYIELGTEAFHIIENLEESLGGEVYVFLRKNLLEQQALEAGLKALGKTPDWSRFPSYVLVNQPVENFPEELNGFVAAEDFGSSIPEPIMSLKERNYQASALPLNDVSGRMLGKMLLLVDISDHLGEFTTVFYRVSTLFIVTGIFLFAVIYIVAGRVERRISQQNRALWVNEERFRTLVEQSPVGTQILDPTGVTIQVNRAWEKLWGTTLDDLDGYNILEDQQLETLGLLPKIRQAFIGQSVFVSAAEYDIQATLGVGEKRWLQSRIYPIVDDHDTILNVILMHEDITERKQAEDALTELNQTLDLRIQERTRELEQANFELKATISQRQLANMQLKHSKELSKTILNVIHDSICLINVDDFTIVDCNEHFKMLHGTEDIIGKTCYAVTHLRTSPCLPPNDTCPLHETLETGEFAIAEHLHFSSSGQKVYVEISTLPIKDLNGKITQVVHLSRDITASKKIEFTLRKAKEEADTANMAKSMFLANMSHDIRSPMNAIIGMNRLALETDLSDEQRHYLSTVQHSSESLLALIDDILDFSKIEAGQLDIIERPFALVELMESILSSFESKAQEKNLELFCDIQALPKEKLIGDDLRLRQIVTNLIGNSVKFTEAGKVSLGIKKQSENDKEITLQFSVSDTGVGIPKNFQERIFNSFAQADDSVTRLYGGTGLGLAICRKLLALLGGEISVKSEPGKGSTFCFTLTFLKETLQQEGILAVEKKAASSFPFDTSLDILVVEDIAINRELAQAVLEKKGHDVILASDGLNALDILTFMDFDLILMDVQMPVMDGISATRIIRRCETEINPRSREHPELVATLASRIYGSHVNIVAMTAHAMSGDRERCIDSGMDNYITKPFQPEELFQVVQELFG